MKRWTLLLLAGAALASGTAGTLDADFGDGGRVVTEADGPLFAIAHQSDGRIVAAGADATGGTVRRYGADGTLDTGFGVVYSPLDSVHGVTVDSLDRILLAGRATIVVTGKGNKQTTKRVFAIARLLDDGALDTSFGSGGLAAADVVGSATGIAIQPDGRLVVGGSAFMTTKFGSGPAKSSDGLMLVRFAANGALDTSFATGGIHLQDLSASYESYGKPALQSDGRIVVPVTGTGNSWRIRRHAANGSLDSTFGSGGSVVGATSDNLRGSVVDGDDRILAIGYRSYGTTSSEGLVVRYDADGAVDTSFADGGAFLTGAPIREELAGVAVAADGKIVLAGNYFPTSGSSESDLDIITYRLNDDGTPDTGYGSGGVGDRSSPGDSVTEGMFGMALAIDGQGRPVVGGIVRTDQDDWLIVRWNG